MSVKIYRGDGEEAVPLNKTIDEHLDSINAVDLISWMLGDAFSLYASSLGHGGKVELGVNGRGQYEVRWKSGKANKTFKYPKDAVSQYKGLLRGSIPEE